MSFNKTVSSFFIFGLVLSSFASFTTRAAGYNEICKILSNDTIGDCTGGLRCLASPDGINRCKSCIEEGGGCIAGNGNYCCGNCEGNVCVGGELPPPPPNPEKCSILGGNSDGSLIDDCVTGKCVNGKCAPIAAGGSCNANGDCAEGYTCYSNTCILSSEIPSHTYQYIGPSVSIEQLITLAYNVLLPVSIAFGVYNVIRAGYVLKTSDGNPQRKQQGIEDLGAAIIGTLFVGLSLTILKIIINSVLGGNVDL